MRKRAPLCPKLLLLFWLLLFRLFFRHLGKMVFLGERLDEFFGFRGAESEELDDVEVIFFGDVVADLVFLEEAANLLELLLRADFDGSGHFAADV